MAKFLKLTDFDSEDKQLVEVDEISSVEPLSEEIETESTVERTAGFWFFKRTVLDTEYNYVDKKGSLITTKNGAELESSETPEQIASLMTNNVYIEME